MKLGIPQLVFLSPPFSLSIFQFDLGQRKKHRSKRTGLRQAPRYNTLESICFGAATFPPFSFFLSVDRGGSWYMPPFPSLDSSCSFKSKS